MRNSIPKFPDFNAAAKQFTWLMSNLPVLVGKEAENHFKDSFQKQAWEGVKWADRKTKDKNPKRRAILVKTARLKRSIRIREVSFGKVVVGTDVPYAKVHNEGGIITGTQSVSAHSVRSHNRRGSQVREHERKAYVRTVNTTIPKRQFMGESALLNQKVEKLIETSVNDVIKRYL